MDVHLRELFGLFQQQFGVGPGLGPGSGTSLMKIDGLSTAFLKSVFRAAAALYRSNPWKRLKSTHLLGVRVGKDADWYEGKHPFYCVQFVGGGGTGDLGLNLFRAEEDASATAGIRSGKFVPQRGLLRVVFVPEADLSYGNRKMIKTLGLETAGLQAYPVIDVAYPTKHESNPIFRNPTLEELRWVYACLRALTQVQIQVIDKLIHGRFESFVHHVDVQWPAEDRKEWEITSVHVSCPPSPPKEAYYEEHQQQQQGSGVPKLAEASEASSSDDGIVESGVARNCIMCDKEVAADQAPRCSRCKAVIYCSQACQKKHWKESHKSNCELYKSMMEREEELEIQGFMFPCMVEHACKWLESLNIHGRGMWRRMCGCCKNCPFGLLPPPEGGGIAGAWGVDRGKYPADEPILDYATGGELVSMVSLSGWAEYYELRALTPDSPVAALLCFPLTLYHILTALNVVTKNLLAKNKEVVVHYLGPEGELDWMPAFTEMGHLLGGSGNLHIMMIGPQIPGSLSGVTEVLLDRRLKVTFVQGLYQDEANSLLLPHIVVGLNSAIGNDKNWIGAVEMIKAIGVPAFFTDYAETCCLNTKQVLRAAGLHISYPVTPNPFRSPLRNQMPSTNVPWFSNGFVLGVNA